MSVPLSAISQTVTTGFEHIDALLNDGPEWNYLTSDGSTFQNTLYYTFSIASGTEDPASMLTQFNHVQQDAARNILAHAAQITGIELRETPNGEEADIHFASKPLDVNTAGLCSTSSGWSYDYNDFLTRYESDAWVYLDNATNGDFVIDTNNNPLPGEWGYETLLHEIGHALGLKHPFEPSDDNSVTLSSPYTDNTAYTVMSYTDGEGGPFSEFNEYDQAALQFLYGNDGLGGDWGLNSPGTYLLGSSLNETFSLSDGVALLDDLGGTDTLEYSNNIESYSLMPDEGWLNIVGLGIDHIISSNVENIQFDDQLFSTAELIADAQITDDYASDVSTDGSVSVGSSVAGSIEESSDADWFAVSLEAGATYQIDLKGADTGDGTLADPNLEGIYTSGKEGTSLISGTSDKDGGTGTNSRVEFIPDNTDTYYISVGAYGDTAGTYTLSVSELEGFFNNAPNANADSVITSEDTQIIIDVLANDTDPDGDSLSLIGTTTPDHGSLSITEDSQIHYSPYAGYTGVDAFSYTISDSNGGSASATVSIEIQQKDLPEDKEWGPDDNFVVLQYASPAVVGSGEGDDIYLLTPSLIGPGQKITLSDTKGANSLQLANGLEISSSKVASNAIQLTLNNNAEITILGADQFTYDPGGNLTAGIDSPDLSFNDFIDQTLGTSVPASGVNNGGSVTLSASTISEGPQLTDEKAYTLELAGIAEQPAQISAA